MTDVQPGVPAAPPSAGAALRARREEAGLDLEEVARRTRVPLRHLQAIEANEYGSLPSVTYAVGFARAYARAVGADEVAVAADARREVERLGRRRPEHEPFVTADPARVPSRGLAAVAAGLALAVAVLAVLWFTTDVFRNVTGGTASEAVVASVPDPAPAAAPRAAPTSAPAAPSPSGQVRLTANDEVWVRVSDAANNTLKLGTMRAGESFDVPRDAAAPVLNVGRPDKLAVTLDGRAVPPLGDGARPVKVAIGAAAVAERLAAPAPAAPAS
jgi:cytoskeletal protein RodZ